MHDISYLAARLDMPWHPHMGWESGACLQAGKRRSVGERLDAREGQTHGQMIMKISVLGLLATFSIRLGWDGRLGPYGAV